MQKILKDDTLDKNLLENGYVIVPFLNQDIVSDLKSYYYAHHPHQNEGMYATAHVSDISFRLKMNDYIKEKFQESIDQYFQNCNPLGGSFIAKGKGGNGTLKPHQDWNLVDEKQFRSFNIWVPLVDLHDKNGAIMIEPGSHLWDFNYRSANIPFAYPEKEQALWESMIRLDMKAGEALIYDHRLIHASPDNFTDEIRLACVYGIIPENASMFYYHKNVDGHIEVYESNPEFFLNSNIFEGPKNLKLLQTIYNEKETFFSKIQNFFLRLKA